MFRCKRTRTSTVWPDLSANRSHRWLDFVHCPHDSLPRAIGTGDPSVSVHSSHRPSPHSNALSQCQSREGLRLHPNTDHLSNTVHRGRSGRPPVCNNACARVCYDGNGRQNLQVCILNPCGTAANASVTHTRQENQASPCLAC